MIRTAAALFAKKTAVVAVTGAVVLGGATLALAEALPEEEPIVEAELMEGVEPDCEDGEVLDEATGECVADEGDGDDAPTCEDDEIVDETTGECVADEDDGDDELEGDDDDEISTIAATDGLMDPETDETEYANHGEAVSTYARVHCRTEAAREHYKNHGECVRAAAQSDLGKGGDETSEPELEATEAEPTDAEPTEQVVEEQAPAPAPTMAPAKPGKPDHAAAKGGGGKGGGSKGGKGGGKK